MSKKAVRTSELPHDALCPKNNPVNYQRDRSTCQCDLISNVRTNERGRFLTLSDRVQKSQYDAGLRDAVAVSNAQRSKFKARDWNDAIDAVVDAIESLSTATSEVSRNQKSAL